MTKSYGSGLSRRQMLAAGAAGAALAGTSVLPGAAVAQTPPARWRRYNVASPQGQAMMVHYQRAIEKMLNLPPDDPRNWYRFAFTHYLDCPHGNWWLLPWHRALTGWAEQIVRAMSGFDGFAFPYWDWTANPQVPQIMSSPMSVLNPSDSEFIGKLDTLKDRFKPVFAKSGYWDPNSITNKQLQARGITSNDELWDQITNPATSPFFPNMQVNPPTPNTRNPNAALDCMAGYAVSPGILAKALAPRDFVTFGSGPADQHSDQSQSQGLLEAQPHNLVHNNTGGVVYQGTIGNCNQFQTPMNYGGFMQDFMSPVDPLFFLHHSNIDRLWDVWTRKQIANGDPVVPPNTAPHYEYTHWANEPFLFFHDAAGRPVTKVKAGDYQTIGDFAYDYEPGSGETRAPLLKAMAPRKPVLRFSSEVPPAAAGTKMLTAVAPTAVRLQPALLQAARTPSQTLLAKVTVTLPGHARGQVFPVLVHPGDPAKSVSAGTIALFGSHRAHGPMTFTVPLGDAMEALRRNGSLKANGFLHFRVVAPAGAGGHHAAPVAALHSGGQRELRVHTVLVEAH